MMLVAAAQAQSSTDWAANLAKGRTAIREAAQRGAGLVVLPELFMAWNVEDTSLDTARALAQPLDGPFVRGLTEEARAAGAWVICGILEEAEGNDPRPFNTTIILDHQGHLVATYRKTHLYDAFGNCESDSIRPGDALFSPVQTPFGRLGLLVCYELRFPEVMRLQAEQGVDIFVVPSAWVAGPLKEHHWQTLATARAIENTAYVVAADQVGRGFIGCSLIVDPMGVALAGGGEIEGVIYADVDRNRVDAVREKAPALRHRRSDLYRKELGRRRGDHIDNGQGQKMANGAGAALS